MQSIRIIVSPENARRVADWIASRGGVALWNTHNPSDPGRSWTTPLTNDDGSPVGKPHWSAGEIIAKATTTDDVDVETVEEVKRFRVTLRRSSNGFTLKCTAASSERIRKAVAKAAKQSINGEAYHEFDYSSQEAVIFVVTGVTRLTDFLKAKVPHGPSQVH